MQILKWVLVIVIAYVAGYFSHFPDADPVSAEASFVPEGCPAPLSAFDEIETALQEDRERVKRLEKTKQESNASSSKMNGQEKNAAQQIPDQLQEGQSKSPITTLDVDPNQPQTSHIESNLSDEEIDKLVAAPFNETLKRTRGPLREQYKNFAEATNQNDWDINTQNRMTDALLGNQYSKFIELESLICRANYCEIRGRELKPNVFGLIMSEMMMQDWWKMGHSLSTNGMKDGAFYALITKATEQ